MLCTARHVYPLYTCNNLISFIHTAGRPLHRRSVIAHKLETICTGELRASSRSDACDSTDDERFPLGVPLPLFGPDGDALRCSTTSLKIVGVGSRAGDPLLLFVISGDGMCRTAAVTAANDACEGMAKPPATESARTKSAEPGRHVHPHQANHTLKQIFTVSRHLQRLH